MREGRTFVLWLGVLALAFTLAGCAQQSQVRESVSVVGGPDEGQYAHATETESDTAAGHEDADHEEEHGHRHHVGLFLGNTHAGGEDKFTVGVDYEYRLTPIFGVGGLVDHASGDHDATIVGGALFVHPWGNSRVLLAPGIEHAHGHNEFLVRVGVSYDFHIGRLTVSPTLNVDFVDGEENTVYGLTFGYGF